MSNIFLKFSPAQHILVEILNSVSKEQSAVMEVTASYSDRPDAIMSSSDQKELTDDQIDELLQRAEARLRSKAAVKTTTELEPSTFKLPKLNCANLPQAPVQISKSVARANISSLLPKDIQQAEGRARKVEDPVTVKKRITEVCYINHRASVLI